MKIEWLREEEAFIAVDSQLLACAALWTSSPANAASLIGTCAWGKVIQCWGVMVGRG